MHGLRVTPFNKIWCPPVTPEEVLQFLVRNTGQDCRIINLVAIQMQDGENSTITDRIKEFVGMPGCGKGCCL